MCLATSANDETWTSSRQISVLEAPFFGVVDGLGAAVVDDVVGSSALFSFTATTKFSTFFDKASGFAKLSPCSNHIRQLLYHLSQSRG